MACPAGRSSIASPIERLVRASVLALVLAAQPALAQEQDTDPELKELIPDSAVDRPEEWAKGDPPLPGESDAPDPAAPLAELPPPAVAWPETLPDPPPVAALPSEPEAELAVPGEIAAPQPVLAAADVVVLSPGLELAFPEDPAALPERRRLVTRFESLSSLLTLAGGAEDNIAQIVVRARTDRQLLERLLRIYGYYQAEVVQSVSGIEPGQEVAAGTAKVRFDVVPGPQFKFGTVALAGLDAAGGDFVLLRSNYDIRTGDPLHNDLIVDERDRLDTALAENGYPFAALGEPALTVDHARREGDLDQPVTPGGKYNYGAVVSDKPEFLSGRHLQRIARFKSGEIYRRSSAEDLRRAILATGIVANVTVTPREVAPPKGDVPGTVDMEVKLVPGPLRTLAGAIGYDSGDGVRVEASWEHRNLFPPEGMLRLRGIAGTKEQLAGVTFRRHNFLARDQVLTFDLYAGNVDRDAYAARSIGFTGTFEKVTTILFRKPLTWAAGFEVLLSDEREALVPLAPPGRRTFTVGALPLRAAYDGSDDLLDPSRGFRAALRVSPEISFQRGQDSTYLRAQADASFYAPIGGNVVLAARGRLGIIPGAPLSTIAPSRRFYAGGGGSVRGFGYQQIGPRDVLGDPSGGRSLAEFSLEARIGTGLFGGSVSVVPFLDAGTVDEASLPRFRDIRYGAGLGLRWATGFGPIRIDVGTPLNRRPGESRIAVYVALGQAF